jgi:hypothetical protein
MREIGLFTHPGPRPVDRDGGRAARAGEPAA